MKLLEHVLDPLISNMMDVNEMQFGFVPGRGTTDAIFIVRQLQEKYIAAKKPLYFAFVDLKKTFDRVPRKVLWCRGMGDTPVPGAACGSTDSTVRSLESEWLCIKVQYSARCSSSWFWRRCHASSALACIWRFCTLMTL